jgi:hypothetical protein
MVLYVNGDTQDVYTESEVRKAYDEDISQLTASGCVAVHPTLSSGSKTSAPLAFSWWTLTTSD